MEEYINVIGQITGSPEEGVEWRIDNFNSLTDWVHYYCPLFDFSGESWRLKMDSFSLKTTEDDDRCIYLCLQKSADGPPVHVECTFSVKTREGTKYGERRNAKEFLSRDRSEDIPILLESERLPELVPFGRLTVLCRLRCIDPNEVAGGSICTNCCYCKESFDADSISSHKKKCLDKPLKCPECSDVVLLRNWYDHECEGGSAEAGSFLPKTRILRDFKQLLFSQEDCDVVIRVKDREFKAHRLILKARSPVLASALRRDMKEKATGIVEIDDVDPSAFLDFLCFLYCEKVDSLSKGNVLGLYTAADKYDVPDLKRMCVEFMRENLCVETFCDVIQLALLHSETELISFCTDFFIKNGTKIIQTVKWEMFYDENPRQSNELLMKFARWVEVKSCKRIKLSDD